METKTQFVEDIMAEQVDSQFVAIIFGADTEDFRGSVSEWKKSPVDTGYVVLSTETIGDVLYIYV